MRYILALIGLLGISIAVNAANPMTLRSFGVDMPVIIYVFTSPSCSHCAAYHDKVWPVLMDEFVKTGKAQVKVVDMPYDAISKKISQLARCMDTDIYNSFMADIYHQQEIWQFDKEPFKRITEIAVNSGMPIADQNKCFARQDVAKRIIEQRDNLSDLYHIRMMPSTVINMPVVQPIVLTGTDVGIIKSEINKALGAK